jgi:hypothetical protein
MRNWLEASRQAGRWWTPIVLPVESWEAGKSALAGTMGPDDWRITAELFACALEWNQISGTVRRYYFWVKPTLRLRTDGLGGMRDAMIDALPVATAALERVATEPSSTA